MEKTLGEKRVKVDFNTTNDSLVDQLKKKSAELIDLCEKMRYETSALMTRADLKTIDSPEKQRLISLAQTDIESACMWIVKANFTE